MNQNAYQEFESYRVPDGGYFSSHLLRFYNIPMTEHEKFKQARAASGDTRKFAYRFRGPRHGRNHTLRQNAVHFSVYIRG